MLSDSILGYDLLKKKADALTARFRKMLHEILDVFYEFFQRNDYTNREVAEQLKEANFSLVEAKWALNDVRYPFLALDLMF